MATRYSDRRYRPLLSGSTPGLEIYLLAGRRVPGGIAGGNDGFQDPAGTMGKRPDPDLQENPAPRAEKQCAGSGEARGLVSPDSESQLPANDRVVGASVASHGYSLLPGMVSDDVHRSSVILGVNILHLELLPGVPEGIISQDLAACSALSPLPYGARHWFDSHQHMRGAGGSRRQAKRIRPHSEIPGGIEKG